MRRMIARGHRAATRIVTSTAGRTCPDGAYATLHPISNSAPDQWQCTRSEEVHCLRIGCSTPINKNKRGVYRSIDATTTSELHEGRRRVELNREISRRDAQ